MAFKFGSKSSVSVESPESMFMDFSERAHKGLLTHQGRILSEYQKTALDKKDVAIKLPTGSGKTLVGLLLAEWRRRKFGERVVYVCPTKQLVNQVVDEAHSKYGMSSSVLGFTGPQKEYNSNAKSQFQSGELVAVTTYGGLFNSNTFFDEPNLILLDDAHASENYLAGFWSVSINRDDHSSVFIALTGALARVISSLDIKRLRGEKAVSWDHGWVDLLPGPVKSDIQEEFIGIVDAHVANSNLRYSWKMLRDNFSSTQIYISSNEILIRPLISPSLRYKPFSNANQRIYMSATLGEGGDLERLVGVKRIHRLSLPDELSAHGVGRRFFIFPGRSLSESDQDEVEQQSVARAGRAVILVPDFRRARQVEEKLKYSGSKIFDAQQIEDSKDPFIQEKNAIAILANRYDGIDFSEDQCRLLIMRGLPGATGLQEKFLLTRMGARLLLQDRIRTRVAQAVGRCTRSLTDYSAVMVIGEEILTYLSKKENRSLLHPELQAEIEFGLEQSGSISEMVENLDLFLKRGEDWRAAEGEIRRLRSSARQMQLDAMDQLAASAPHEVDYQYALWDGDSSSALEAARKVLSTLQAPSLRGYRAHWLYLAGCAADQMARSEGIFADKSIAKDYFELAAKSVGGISWLRTLAGSREKSDADGANQPLSFTLMPRMERLIGDLGTHHDQKYNNFEREIIDGIQQDSASQFEISHMKLGLLLGYDAGKEESDGSPDPWWLVDENLCFVFEDHSESSPDSKVSVQKARQAASHPNWIRKRLGLSEDAVVLPILLTQTSSCDPAAAVHLKDVAVWKIADFRSWASRAIAMIRERRVEFPGEGDLVWREATLRAYGRAEADPESLIKKLKPLGGKDTF